MAPEDALMRERIRILRGRILEALREFVKHAAPSVQLTQLESLLRDHRRDEIETQISYLMDKHYVADATTRLDHRDRRGVEAVRITTAGIDLVEGVTTDDAVEFHS